MRYMVIETYRNGDAAAVYRRFLQEGRQMPDGVRYISSWVTEDLKKCFQVMECEAPAKLTQWMNQWIDLVSFEVVPVISSAEAAGRALNPAPVTD